MSAARDFDGFPLALGEVYGIRVWKVDDYGRLRARHVTSPPWRPGVNTATCQAGLRMTMNSWARAVGIIGKGGVTFLPGEETEPPAAHTAPGEQCQCGFYAYTEPVPASYELGALVTGVVRGTGRVLIGTKGFRCEKAEIVALLNPRMVDDYLPAGDVGGDQCDCPNCKLPDAPYGWQVWAADRMRALYPDVPLLGSRAELMGFAPIRSNAPDPSTDEFWTLP